MDAKKSKILLIIALVYILSQVVLFLSVGKDLELILLSLGIFLASVISVFAIDFSAIQIGRPIVESVSMRRARQPKEVREQMLRDGYKIDEEFLHMKRFTLRSKPTLKPPIAPVETPQTSPPIVEVSPIEKFEKDLLGQAPMFGGLEKMREVINTMEDSRIEFMLKRMGYKGITVQQVRLSIEKLVAQANTQYIWGSAS